MIEKIIGRNISILYRHEITLVDSQLKELHISKIQAEVLLFIKDYDGVNLTVINNFFKFNKATITKITKHLEISRYVRSINNEHDKREKIMFLTKKGTGIIPIIFDVFRKWEELVINNIPDVDIEITRTVLAKMVENITKN